MGIVIAWLVLSALVGWLASSKGRSGFVGFLVAALMSPLIGLIIYLAIGEGAGAKMARIYEEERIRDQVRREMDGRIR